MPCTSTWTPAQCQPTVVTLPAPSRRQRFSAVWRRLHCALTLAHFRGRYGVYSYPGRTPGSRIEWACKHCDKELA